jgi:DNA-binding Xre family transcriptional regulator
MAGQPTASASAGTLTGLPMAPRATAVALPSLRHWRIQRTLMQRELAEAGGIDLRSIQRLEAGGRAGLDTVRQLARALQVQASDLMAQPPAAED